MAKYKLFLTPSAYSDLGKIDPVFRQRFKKKLDYFLRADDPLVFAVQLTGIKPKTYRYRVGKYRIFFDIKDDTVRILRISLRDKAYHDL